MQKHTCPICGYNELEANPGSSPRFWGSQEICPSCGWQFGYNNPATIKHYRAEWVEAGAHWFFPEKQPAHWNVAAQLAHIGLTVDDVLRTPQLV